MKKITQIIRKYFTKKPKFQNPTLHDPNPNKKGFKNITLKSKHTFQWNGPDFKKVFPMK
jgi:hypothetical protein